MTFLGQLSYIAAMFLIVDHLWRGRDGDETALDVARKTIWEFLRSEKVKRFLADLGKPTERR